MNFERRLERLEQRVVPPPGPRHVLVTNVPPDVETAYTLEVGVGLYVDVLGKALSEREVKELREKYRREESQ
jgi:hypothetical protein